MLIHPWDTLGTEEVGGFLASHTFGQLITSALVEGHPVVVPTHFSFDGASTVLLHLARPNPIWRALEEDPRVLLSVVADYAYVEARWNAGPEGDPTRGVPTSYYTAVQLLGVATLIDDPDTKVEVLGRQLADFEPPDSVRRMPSVHDETDRRMLPGIRALRIDVCEIRAKAKYGGNKSAEHRQFVADSFGVRGAVGDAEVAQRLYAAQNTDMTTG